MPDPVPNPIAAQVMATPPPDVSAPVNMPQGSGPTLPPSPQPQVQLSPQQANIAHSAAIGHGWKALGNLLNGTTTQYQQTPNGPVPVQVPDKPGQLFKSILQGAIMGAATGGQTDMRASAGSGWGAAARGAGGAMQARQQQQQQAQQQAQQQFENQQKANSAATEDQLRKAQIGMYNMQKLKDLQEIQGGDYTSHKRLVDDARSTVESYNATGLKPVVEGLSEEEHTQYMKSNPGAATLDWQPSGMKQYVDKDGNVNYQTVWNAYDPKGKITITPSVMKDWQDSGVLNMNPELKTVLKPDENGNRQIPYTAFMKLDQQNKQMKADARTKEQSDYLTKHDDAQLKELAAAEQAHKAAAAASGDEAQLREFEIKEKKNAIAAQTILAKNGGDWTKLAPDQKVALQPVVQADIADARAQLNDPLLKQQLNSNDPDVVKAAQERAGQLHEQLDTAMHHRIDIPPSAEKKVAHPEVVEALQGIAGLNPAGITTLANMDPSAYAGYLAAAKIPDDMKAQLYHALKIQPPAGTAKSVLDKISALNEAIGSRVKGTVGPAASAVKDYLVREGKGLAGMNTTPNQ